MINFEIAIDISSHLINQRGSIIYIIHKVQE